MLLCVLKLDASALDFKTYNRAMDVYEQLIEERDVIGKMLNKYIGTLTTDNIINEDLEEYTANPNSLTYLLTSKSQHLSPDA